MRRDPRRWWRFGALRLRYQAQLFRTSGELGRAHAVRALGAFAGGVGYGVRLRRR
jgi:hypothetical protein